MPLNNTALVGVPERDAGVAVTLNASQQIGYSLGIALLNTIYVTVATRYVAGHGRTVAAVRTAEVAMGCPVSASGL